MDDDDWGLIAAEQRLEIKAAKELDADLDLAFQLQVQEAITASISLQPSSSSSPPDPPPVFSGDGFVSVTDFQAEELLKMEQELRDRKLSESEFNTMRDDLHRRMHDERVAAEIHSMPEHEWENFGDNFENPFYAEGGDRSEAFRIYFKGSTMNEWNGDDAQVHNYEGFGGVGVAVCDSRDQLLFELAKPVSGNGLSRVVMEFMALIEGLNTALELDLKRVFVYCHHHPLFQYVTRQWVPRQLKVVALLNQVAELQGKFVTCTPCLVAGNDVKFAFKLARDALMAQLNKTAESSARMSLYETCAICLEDRQADQIFSVDNCSHRYCYSCMKQHVEVKMLSGIVPNCPHESCESELNVDSCTKFLTPMLIDRMKQRKIEASVPVTERVYCPYPTCSALMSKGEARTYYTGNFGAQVTICGKCGNPFCMFCKVPWHCNMTCADYKSRYPHAPALDLKLKNLAATNFWRQCKKCNHMIELATGCNHITCRCGYEFCYICGAEWRNKEAICSCPLWDEQNLMDEGED